MITRQLLFCAEISVSFRKFMKLQFVEKKPRENVAMEFYALKEDRIIFLSDGVTQSGIGSPDLKMGWGHQQVVDFILKQIKNQPKLSATKLAQKIVNRALANDKYSLRDDTSCGVVYFREPREVMLITGPPFYKIKDQGFIQRIKEFTGMKMICGGTTAEIIARELGLKLDMVQYFADMSLPPASILEGFDLVTEGILTISKVEEIGKLFYKLGYMIH